MQDIYSKFTDFKSFEVSFVDSHKEPHRNLCTVKSIENNRIVLMANNHDNKNIFPNVDQELQLHICTDQGIYSAKSKLLSITGGLLSTEYTISYPSHSKHSQRREYFRADISVPFKMKVHKNNDINDFFFVDGSSRNICGKGMSFISDKPFMDASAIEVALFFDNHEIVTTAELVYAQPLRTSGAPKFVNAFTFTNIAVRNIEFIIKKCFFYQLDLRKNLI